MQQTFWHDKWQAEQTGFHLEAAHPLLQKFHSRVFTNANKVFVPLCGKTKDLIYLSEQGYSVIGNELSEKAVKTFYAENYQLEKAQIESLKIDTGANVLIRKCLDHHGHHSRSHSHNHNHSKLTEFSLGRVSVFQGDFFQLQTDQLANVFAIYDRAALVALPKEMRVGYVNHLSQLFKSANLLLITLEYDQSKMSGPPFSVTPKEVSRLFSDANIEKLYSKDIIDKEPRFKGKGLESFIETAYKISW